MSKNHTQFTIQYIQYLNEASILAQPLPTFLNAKELTDLYRSMCFTRAFDAKAVALQRTGKLGTFPSSLGQEAIYVAAGYTLKQNDVLAPAYRDQGALLMRGVKVSQLFSYWGGDERGNLFSASNAEDLPFAIPIASQCLHAAGIGYAMKLRQQPRAVLVSIGDGGTSEGDFYEAMNFAGAFKLPVVFLINNNQWAISVSRYNQTASQTLAQKAISCGFEGVQVDGNDVIGVVDVLTSALNKARTGGGPTLVEAITYRLCDHTTADDAKRYSNVADIEAAWQKEPVLRLKRYLEKEMSWTEEQDKALQIECVENIAKEVDVYVNTPLQPTTAVVDYMYETWPAAYQDQRDRLVNEKVPEHA